MSTGKKKKKTAVDSSFISDRATTADDNTTIEYLRFCLGTDGILSGSKKKDEDDEDYVSDGERGSAPLKKKAKASGKKKVVPKFTGNKEITYADLPGDILLYIFELLDPLPTLLRCAAVCKSWRSTLLSKDAFFVWDSLDFSCKPIVSPAQVVFLVKKFAPCWTKVKRVSFHGCSFISDEAFRKVLDLCENTLESISLTQCTKLSKESLDELVSRPLPHLTEILLAMLPKATDKLVKGIAEKYKDKITSFDACGSTNIKVAVRDIILKCAPNMEELDISGLTVSPAHIEKLQKTMSRLHTLRMKQCMVHDTKNFAGKLAFDTNLGALKHLDVSYSEFGNGRLLRNFLEAPSLSTLDLSGVTHCRVYRNFAKGVDMKSVKELTLRSNDQIHEDDVIGLIDACAARLESIDLSWSTQVSDAVCDFLAQSSPGLHTLKLSGTRIHENGLKNIFRSLNNLKDVQVESCRAFARDVRRLPTAELREWAMEVVDLT